MIDIKEGIARQDRMVRRVALGRAVADPAMDGEDVLQDVYLRLTIMARRGDDPDLPSDVALRGYLYHACHNRAVSLGRRAYKRPTLPLAEWMTGWSATENEALAALEADARVEALLAALGAARDERAADEALMDALVALGWHYTEIAVALGLSVPAVRTRLHRYRRRRDAAPQHEGVPDAADVPPPPVPG